MKQRGATHPLAVARSEWKNEKREKLMVYSLASVVIITALVFLLFLSLDTLQLTGRAHDINATAGTITSLELEQSFPVNVWSGFYGLALRVPGFSEQISEEIDSGTIERLDTFFDCIDPDATGGPEIYASTSSSLDFSDVQPGTFGAVDSFSGCTADEYCADDTFTTNLTYYVGETEISEVPATYTFQLNTESVVFDIGVLNVSGDLAFVARINSSVQAGFNPDVTVNYQMLLPIPANTSQTYYFFTDPNDECPTGGFGSTFNASMFGYTFEDGDGLLDNVTVTVAGYNDISNQSGFYNVSFLVIPGTYTVIGDKDGYEPFIGNVTVDFSNPVRHQNITMVPEQPPSETVTPLVFGRVRSTQGSALNNVSISLGNATTFSNSSGDYSFRPTVALGENPIVAILTDYDNYVELLNFTNTTSQVNHNFSMSPVNDNAFETGPDTEPGDSDDDNVDIGPFLERAEEAGQDFWIAPNEIDVQVRKNTFIEVDVSVYNFQSGTLNVVFTLSPEIEDFVRLDRSTLSIPTNNFDTITLTILGTPPLGVYEGTITVSGELDQEIPVTIEVVDRKLPVETLFMEVDLLRNVVRPGSDLNYRASMQNLLTDQSYIVDLTHEIVDEDGTEIYVSETEEVEILNSLTLIKSLKLPDDLPEDDYILRVTAQYFNLFTIVNEPFSVSQLLLFYSFFGIPVWVLFIIVGFLAFSVFGYYMYRLQLKRKKRFRVAVDYNTLPKPGDRSIKIGYIAETKKPAYYDLDAFTTHGIVAGATGGGKSISAQVFIEEALQKNIAVIVFDPTAQWSGMLRKCEDKKMLSFYPKFGLKPSDAQAFPGNVRQVVNERQKIDVEKYVRPGQIQIFTLNKLDPSKMDTFVAGVIAQIFRSDPKEHAGLRVMLVFDEVHRLLPRFGGGGAGFLQIERACREFRKWGYGVMLVSQVLSDFVGEIKANINTEVQMRVAEERDLERIRERYGLDALKSLVRAGVGTGMIQNAEYNRGRPYFVNFRPILHNTKRLSDEVLEKYNQYSDKIDDLDFQIVQLEKEKVDVFDLKMELKLVKDKLMQGNFTVVDIYLEGLEPRVAKQWEAIGKKPKERKIELISEEEVQKSLQAAKKERQKWDKGKKPAGGEEKKEEKADPLAKQVKAFTFDNGIMVSSMKELKDVLPNLDGDVFKNQKSALSKWIKDEVDPGLGDKAAKANAKQDLVKAIDSFGKGGKKKEGSEDKRENKKSPEKKEGSDRPKKKVSLQKLKKKKS